MNKNVRAVLAIAAALSAQGTWVLSGAAAADTLPVVRTGPDNQVPACATPGRIMAYLASRNPGLDPRYAGIALHYKTLGQAMGLRWDYAFFQMLVETGNLSFKRGDGRPGLVSAAQNNFAGLGAVGGGETGDSFPDIATGVKAHLQHLAMYAGERIEQPVAERTRKVQAWGVLTAWHKSLHHPIDFTDVTRRWAADPAYASSVELVGRRYYDVYCTKGEPSAPASGQQIAAAAPLPVAAEPARARPQPETTTASDSVRVSGADLARAAVERARSEGDSRRSGLGFAPIGESVRPPAAKSEPAMSEAAATTSTAGPNVATAPQKAAPVQASAAGAVTASVAAAAKPVNPADEAVRTLISGKTFVLDATMGATIPIVFRENGSMHGSAGSLAPFLGSASDEGRWWVARGRLCQRWNVWLSRETQCLQLRQAGPIIHWVRDDGKSGTARIASR